jgi:hypothetical protein
MGNLLIGLSAAGMAFTHTVAHRAATVNAPATSSKNEFATSVTVGATPDTGDENRSHPHAMNYVSLAGSNT